MRDFRRLLKYLRPHRIKFAFATLAMIVAGLLQSAILLLIAPIIEHAFNIGGTQTATSGRATRFLNLENFIPSDGLAAWKTISILLIVFTIGKGIAEYLSTYLMASIGQSAVMNLRSDMYRHLLRQSADFYERHRTNYLVSRLVTSATAIENAITTTLRDMLREGWQFIALIGTAFYMSWRMTLSIFIVAPIVSLITARFGKAMRRLASETQIGSQQLVDTAQETLSNHTIVKAYTAESRERTRFQKVAERIVHANLRTAKLNGIAPPTIELIGVIAIILLLYFGQREIALGRLNTPQFLTFVALIFSAYDPMRKLSRLHNAMEQALAAVRHVWEVLDENRELYEKPNAIKIEGLERGIELRHVSFKYANSDDEEHRAILDDMSLTIPKGSIVALVGESGSGKSTLTKLIPRFHDASNGEILWDDVDLRDVNIKSLREQIAIVTQETTLFNDTVRYNISYSRPRATDAEIKHAAHVALADDFVSELPAGYDTVVGERGVFLSGGQRQRLAIARAVLANSPVLILDEATSALDTQSERLVQQALTNLMRDRTTIVIAHRLSTVRRADKIVVMERGRIIESGTHAELLTHGGAYNHLYELQFADEETDRKLKIENQPSVETELLSLSSDL